MTVQPNSKNTKKIAGKSILLAVIAIIELLLLLISFSFSWFEGGTALNLLGRNIKTDKVLYSAIQVGEGSEYQQVISLTDYFSAQNKAKFNPVSSVDGKTFYTMYQGNVSNFHSDPSLVKWRKLATENINSSILKFQFQVYSPISECYFWFKELPTVTVNGVKNSELSKAFRIHFDDGNHSVTTTVADSWYSNYSGTAVNSLGSNDSAVIANNASVQFAKDYLYNDSTYNTKYLFHCAAGETVTVTCSVWLEATDPVAAQIAPGSDVSFDVQISSSFSQMTKIQVSAANIAKGSLDAIELLPSDTELEYNDNDSFELPEETKPLEEPTEDESTEDVAEGSDAETTAPETFEDAVITDPSFTEEETSSEDTDTESSEEIPGVGSTKELFTNSNASGENMVLELYNADSPKSQRRCIYTAEYIPEDNCWIVQVPVALQNIKLVYHKAGDITKVEGEWLATERGTNNVYTLIDNDTGVWALPSEVDFENKVEVSEDVAEQPTEDEPLEPVMGESSEAIFEDVSEEASDDISDDTVTEDSNDGSSVENELSDESESFEGSHEQEMLEESKDSSEQAQ